MFKKFNAPKDKMLKNQLATISAILTKWPQNPLAGQLKALSKDFQMIAEAGN